MQIPIDDDIIKGCIENKRESQYLLYKKYYEQCFRICLRYTKSRDEASEILNAAFLKIFSKINSFTSNGDFNGWIYRIVVNTALDHLKANKKYNQQVDIEEADEEFNEFEASSSIQVKDLLKMIQSLPDMQSQVFNLFAIEGYTHIEIAQMLSISEANSKWHLFNARKTLRNQINNSLDEN